MKANEIYQAVMGPGLKHYGVKGMKWGVRKDRRSSGQSGTMNSTVKPKKGMTFDGREILSVKKTKKNPDGSYTSRVVLADGTKSGQRIPKRARRMDPSKMSEADLKKVIARMQLEQQYKQLTATKPGARAAVKAELGKIAKDQAVKIGTRAATIAVAKAFGFAASKTPNPAVSQILKQLGG